MTPYFWVFVVVAFVLKIASQCDRGEVRLVGGSGPHEGRVEICLNSQWGRVCSALWDDNDATVVCRQLGYSPHGSTTSIGTEFGQGDGPRWLDSVHCDPTRNRTLLDCEHMGASFASCRDHDAGVKCRDGQRMINITAHIINTPSTSTVHTVLVTWEQNLTVEEPTSFKVECHNEQHSITIRVSNKTLNAQLGGLLSSMYNCCVTAVYPMYEANLRALCTGINTTEDVIVMSTASESSFASMCNKQSRISECEELRCSNLITIIVGGVLGITIVILLSSLLLSMVCLIRQHTRKGVISESIPTQRNESYSLVLLRESQSKKGTSTQVMRSTSEDESATNHIYDVIQCPS